MEYLHAQTAAAAAATPDCAAQSLLARPPSLIDKLEYTLPKIRLMLVREPIGKRRGKKPTIKRPSDALKLLRPLKHAAEEKFISIHLNSKLEVTGLHEVSHGTLSSSLVHPREVFKAALLANTFAIIVCHNHPSGSTLSPSQEDLDATKQLVAAGKLIGISVIDHLIVGPRARRHYYSIRENYPTVWD